MMSEELFDGVLGQQNASFDLHALESLLQEIMGASALNSPDWAAQLDTSPAPLPLLDPTGLFPFLSRPEPTPRTFWDIFLNGMFLFRCFYQGLIYDLLDLLFHFNGNIFS